jgi:radical SAM superfamily enzyme YgiQ (UPF0313 family)
MIKHKLKVLFIETPSPYLVRQHTQIPIGLLTIATIVEKAGFSTKYIRPLTFENINQYLNVDIICLSGSTLEYPMNCELAKYIKNINSKIKIFIGGTHVSVLYQEVSGSGLFDAIAVGEGENLILKMLYDVQNNILKPIYFMKEYIQDLDSLPFLNYNLIEGELGGQIFFEKRKGNSVNFITSRGCPFNCAFCASQVMWQRKMRWRSIPSIIQEMKVLKEKYNVTLFRLADDNITASRKKCIEFCNAIKNLDVNWRCSIRAESITSEMAEAMYNSGCREISPGIESGDQRVLDYLNKHTTLEKMLKGCHNAQKAGLKVRALFLIGTPGEREDTPELTREYLKKLNPDYATLSTFLPLPGIPIWNNPEKFNCEILSKDFRKYNKDFWMRVHGKAKKREYEPLIWNKFLTIEQQKDNVRRMESYIEELNYNKG